MESDGLNVKRQFPKIKDTCFIVKCKISYFFKMSYTRYFFYIGQAIKHGCRAWKVEKTLKLKKGRGPNLLTALSISL